MGGTFLARELWETDALDALLVGFTEVTASTTIGGVLGNVDTSSKTFKLLCGAARLGDTLSEGTGFVGLA